MSRRPGLTLAVKDLFDTDRLTTTYGSIIFAEHVPPRTASAVLRLERAGLAIVGKTNLDEFAYGVTSQNPHFGAAPNALDPTRTAGGSSGGSAAAVAAGLAELALGTDSAGSIRIPAACCGVVGFKPTHGLVSLEGCFPLAPSFDHAGPIARTSDACAAAMKMGAHVPQTVSSLPRRVDGRGRLDQSRRTAGATSSGACRGPFPSPASDRVPLAGRNRCWVHA